MKPVISIYAPSIRPQLWMRMYNSLLSNKISFELIFVGNIDPPYILPDNVHHLHTDVKPVQCAEIGFRVCSGEFCMYIADDIVFSKYALDILYEESIAKGDNVVLSCIPALNGNKIKTSYYRFFPADEISTYREDSPITPLGGLYKKDTIKELGGIDRNFICTAWDIDLAMRFYEKGGTAEFCKLVVANEVVPQQSGRLATEGYLDRGFLESLWTIPCVKYKEMSEESRSHLEICYIDESLPFGVILKHRTSSVTPFDDVNIMMVSQGPKGRWV